MARIVYLIDDDAAVRKALALVFRSVQLDVKAFGSAEEFLAAYQPAAPEDRGCVVTDVRMPGMSGLDLQDELHRRNIQLPLIVISAHANIPQAVRAMLAGALTVLEKPVNEQELIDDIHRALSPQVAEEKLGHSAALDGYRKLLTGRQCEVFDLLMLGLQTKDVARRLDLSHRTVEVHRARILKRLQLTSFSSLLRQLLGTPERT